MNPMSPILISPKPPFPAAMALLASAKLPVEDLTPAHCEHFFFTGPASAPEGLIGLELFDDVALLRSFVVSAAQRGAGAGSRLLAHAEAHALSQGVRRVYLLTTTAESFFARRGYERAMREAAPAAIRGTREFAGICPASSAFMVKQLA
jgi:amino-acid N-acetyltransferase